MSPEFIFDYGILSNCAKKAEASQNAGRLKGNIKNWANYKQPTVFTTAKFNKIAEEFEEKSRRLAVLAHEKQQNGEETIVTKGEFKNMSEDENWELFKDEFKTLDQANEYLHSKKCRRKYKLTENTDGFIMSSTTATKQVLDNDTVRKEMENWGITSNLDLKNGKKKDKGSRLYVAYKDITDNTTAVYMVRIAIRKPTK